MSCRQHRIQTLGAISMVCPTNITSNLNNNHNTYPRMYIFEHTATVATCKQLSMYTVLAIRPLLF